MFRELERTLLGSLLAVACLGAAANAQDESLVTLDSTHGDGALWFQSLGGSSSGGAQLGAYRLLGAGSGSLAGIHWAMLKWNDSKVLYVTGKDTVAVDTAVVETSPGILLADCRGVATLNGGYVVTDPPAAPVSYVHPHVGALAWTGTGLYAVEGSDIAAMPGAVTVLPMLPGLFRGVTVLGSKIDDVGTVSGVVDSHVVASALAYRDDKVFRIEVDMGGGGIAAPAYEVLDPSGASIPYLLGITVLNAGFRASTVAGAPDMPEGVAVLWNRDHVWYYVHRTTGDTITEVAHPSSGGPIVGCWGVMPIYYNASPGPLLPGGSIDATHCYDIFTEYENCIAQGTVVNRVLEAQVHDFPTNVIVSTNPLLKRQANGLYEIQAKSGADGTRGMVIGLGQRTP